MSAAPGDSVLERELRHALVRHAAQGVDQRQALEIATVLLILRQQLGRDDWYRIGEMGDSRLSDVLEDAGAAVLEDLFTSVGRRWLRELIWILDKVLGERGMTEAEAYDVVRRALGDEEEVYTPDAIVDLMVSMLRPEPGQTIYDPYARGGEFLIRAAEYVSAEGRRFPNAFLGTVPTSPDQRMADMNLRLHSVGGAVQVDQPLLWGGATYRTFDFALANPPFNMPLPLEIDTSADHWRYGRPPKSNANFAWLQHIAAALADEGSAGVVMAASAASSQNSAELAVRSAMVEDGIVSSLIALPSHMFATTTVPVTLWMLSRSFQRAARDGAPRGILFIDARHLGTMRTRTQRSLSAEEIDRVVTAYQEWQTNAVFADVPGFAHAATVEEIRDHEYDLSPGRYVGSAPRLQDDPESAVSITALLDEVERRQVEADDAAARMREQLGRLDG